MHGWAKLIRGVVSYPAARNAVTSAQRIVTFVRASHATLAAFQDLYKTLKLKGGGLATSNTTRLTSVIVMMASVARNQPALQGLLGYDGLRLPPEIKSILQDPGFWRMVKALAQLLRPVEQVRSRQHAH